MWGNRLNCWNTNPSLKRALRNRCSLSFPGSSQTTSPSSKILPLVGRSRAISSLRMVVFPEPLGPMMTSFSPIPTFKLQASRTIVSLKRLQTSMYSTIAPPVGPCDPSGVGDAPLKGSNEDAGWVADGEVEDSGDGEWLEGVIRLCSNLAADAEQFLNSDSRQKSGLFEHGDHGIAERGEDSWDRLRENHVPPYADTREVEGSRCVPLPAVDAVDAAPVDLGGVGAVVHP